MDECKNCTFRGDIKACLNVTCSRHDSWYATIQDKRNKRLESALSDLLASIGGQTKLCGHDFYCVCPTDNAKKSLNDRKEKPA